MKFARELENELVPEWRVKYLDYKKGKKKIKAIVRALRNVNHPLRPGARWLNAPGLSPDASRLPYTHYDFTGGRADLPLKRPAGADIEYATPPGKTSKPGPLRRGSTTILMHTPPLLAAETQPLTARANLQTRHDQLPKNYNYGSFGATPTPQANSPGQAPEAFQLPDPALSPFKARKHGDQKPDAGPAPTRHRNALSLPRHLFRPSRSPSTPEAISVTPSPFLRRMFSGSVGGTPRTPDIPLDAYRELDSKQHEFFKFLDKELDKIESFYAMKEEEASARLHALRAQLHEMRDRRLAELLTARKHADQTNKTFADLNSIPNGYSRDRPHGFVMPFENIVHRKRRKESIGEAMTQLGSPSVRAPVDHDAQRDYVRHADQNQRVPYREAKRKLKTALQEFYRGLELLKSYALLNRTAFRKINKKYDKAVNARPTGRYMTERVNKAYFVRSDVIESYIVAVEDLYARYFERGNHKIAVGKLRGRMSRSRDYTQTSFRNGIWLAGGAALGIQGMLHGFQHLHYHGNPAVRLQTSYLMQLYGGYFLGVLLALLFALDCRGWTRSKINYIFVFEYDSRQVLDWRELAELPSFFLFLNGLFIWLNFRRGAENDMFLYWPVILVGVTLIIMCMPFRLIYHRSRMWFGYSNWRLLLAGLYPVEFRDFFLGDMYCSLTYAMGNVEVFFCLYAQGWTNPPVCNSTHSRLLGFLAALPAIWRALQCIRRYYDSRNWFPHLANCGKYTISILYYMSLSLYRVDTTTSLRSLFIFFGAINAIYCSIWDIAMDWSLGNPYATHPYLRNTLGYRRVWIYYAAMFLDPILRFSWIFYAIFDHRTQHSTVVSFGIALAEVVRRGIWANFRVENEHCTNVGQFRASRDIPLPYCLKISPRGSEELTRPVGGHSPSGVDLEHTASTSAESLRLRRATTIAGISPMTRGIHRVGTIINQAHTQDFERRNRAGLVGDSPVHMSGSRHDDSSDDDDENGGPSGDHADAEDMLQAGATIERPQS